ncbi:MAG: AbrB/MazE/SpoVT family DNA-binding domain-containing protein [Oscillospiraceae bacterium]|nr:AbrB/MazE/SpoVT family DNA-binding domain-containing protein [Oscillospiraceae bacterium]
MKATGIVRRIDDLGRVVIPKEIRRTMRIREGDPLEIYTDSDGEVIFKKYSPIGEISGVTERYAEVLNKGTGVPVIITDRDMAVACSGLPRKEVLERRVTPALEGIMERRGGWTAAADTEPLRPVEGLERFGGIVYPIIGAGDVLGSVVLLMGEDGTQPTQTETKLVQIAAAFLGKQMEE